MSAVWDSVLDSGDSEHKKARKNAEEINRLHSSSNFIECSRNGGSFSMMNVDRVHLPKHVMTSELHTVLVNKYF